MSAHWRILCGLVLLVWTAGCGQTGTAPAPDAAGHAAVNNDTPTELPTASIEQANTDPIPEAEPEKGTPEWLIVEIQRIRVLPLPVIPGQNTGDDENDTTSGEPVAPEASAEEIQKLLVQSRQLRRERNLQIVDLATEALTLTAKDPEKEPVFNVAVSQLLDARLQLALQGDKDSITALYEWAEALHERKPDSAAAEAQLTVVNLAHAHTLRYGTSEPSWMQEFSRQAQLFATRFPQEQARVLPLLMAAGRSCELHGMLDEAKSCYGVIHTKFPESPQGKQSEGILRRLTLVGQPLQFAGPTLDGNFVSVDDSKGKAVIIVFWATHVKPFHDQVQQLQSLGEKYKKYANVLSVSLDSEEGEVDAFLEQTKLTWPVIFHVEPDKRGWNSPLAAHYGITTLPTIWIVDPTGVVAETRITTETLEPKLREILLKHINAGANKGEKAAGTDATKTNR